MTIMCDSIQIRNVRASDYGFLCQAFEQANREHCEMAPSYYREIKPIISKPYFYLLMAMQRLKYGRNRICAKIAEKDDKSIGAIYAYSTKRGALSWSAFNKVAFIDILAVTPENRNCGAGKALILAAKQWAIQTNHSYIHADIHVENKKALVLAQKHGIRPNTINIGMCLK